MESWQWQLPEWSPTRILTCSAGRWGIVKDSIRLTSSNAMVAIWPAWFLPEIDHKKDNQFQKMQQEGNKTARGKKNTWWQMIFTYRFAVAVLTLSCKHLQWSQPYKRRTCQWCCQTRSTNHLEIRPPKRRHMSENLCFFQSDIFSNVFQLCTAQLRLLLEKALVTAEKKNRMRRTEDVHNRDWFVELRLTSVLAYYFWQIRDAKSQQQEMTVGGQSDNRSVRTCMGELLAERDVKPTMSLKKMVTQLYTSGDTLLFIFSCNATDFGNIWKGTHFLFQENVDGTRECFSIGCHVQEQYLIQHGIWFFLLSP